MSQQSETRKYEEKTGPFIKEIQQRKDSTMDSTQEFIDESRDRVKELSREAMSQLQQVPVLIRKHPIEAVLIGFGVGVLATYLVRKTL